MDQSGRVFRKCSCGHLEFIGPEDAQCSACGKGDESSHSALMDLLEKEGAVQRKFRSPVEHLTREFERKHAFERKEKP